jgi:hypothetical protein
MAQWQRIRRVAALVLLASSTVVAADAVAAVPASAAANCHYNNVATTGYYAQVDRTGSTGDMRYPATLHNATLTLYSHTADASVKVSVSNGRAGDIVSVDRSNFLVTGTADHYFQPTSWVQARGTWDYCEKTLSGTSASLQGIDGAHRWIRVCLRRSGALQCTNIWYGDNDDETGDSTVMAP